MNDNIEEIFENLEGQFDVETPSLGHEQRFLEKLKGNTSDAEIVQSKTSYWKPLLGIAATVALILTITFNITNQVEDKDLASISPELAETQDFFSNTITFELNKLNAEQAPESKKLVEDALLRLNKLELEYQNLKLNLKESGKDQRVIYGMITNFQNRIDLLQSTLLKIEELKTLKQNNYETTL